MDWFFRLFAPQSVALTCFTLALVAALGLAVGSLRFRGFSLGVPGVMFAGLLVGRALGKENFSGQTLAFVRDFGLILFVYAVGMQVGPGFFQGLRKRGLALNLMALAVVLLGAVLSMGIAAAAHLDPKAAVGLFTGGTTNAPALGSAEEALRSLHPAVGATTRGSTADTAGQASVGSLEFAQSTAPAFAIAYPFGLLGVILAMVVLRLVFRVDPKAEEAHLVSAERSHRALETASIVVQNKNLNDLPLKDLPALDRSGIVISRILHNGQLSIPTPETHVHVGDVLLAVGDAAEVRDFQLIVGQASKVDLRAINASIMTRQVLVTRAEVLGTSVAELDLPEKCGVAITRISRAGMEFAAVGPIHLQFGDRVRVVGQATDLDAAAKLLGDSVRDLNLPRLLPIFVGILLGVFLGSIPIAVPDLPAPIRLGLASGPMIVAILLASVGRIGSLIYFVPVSASNMLRELGIVLFLTAVGINGSAGFFDMLGKPEGLHWLLLGAVITLVPLLLVGAFARVVLRMNYLHVCGMLCGSMTSPSLAFTQTMTPSEAPAVSFAAVYPLTMIARVLVAQLLILIFVR